MPTDYTQHVKDGSITQLDEFALHCAKAFDHYRINHGRSLADAYRKSCDETMALSSELQSVQSMTPLQAEIAALAEWNMANARHVTLKNQMLNARDYCALVLDKVLSWQYDKALEPLKSFMQEQIEMALANDCRLETLTPHEPVRKSGAEWREWKLADLAKRVTASHMRSLGIAHDIAAIEAWRVGLKRAFPDCKMEET